MTTIWFFFLVLVVGQAVAWSATFQIRAMNKRREFGGTSLWKVMAAVNVVVLVIALVSLLPWLAAI